jgi:MFS family permease
LLGRLSMLRDDAAFRNFVIARALMMGSALIAPYYVILAQRGTDGAIAVLGYLIVASGLAQWSSSVFWGRYADRSSRLVMVWASVLSAVLGVFVLTAYRIGFGPTHLPLWHAAIFFVAVVAHSGVRVGRKTYVVDLGGDDKRAHYVAVSNTLMGILLLIAGSIGALLGAWSPFAAIAFFAASSLAGAALGRSLREVTHEP